MTLDEFVARLDFGAKNTEYQSIPLLRVYVVLNPSAVAAHVFRRDANGEWGYEALGPEDVLDLSEAGVTSPLAEIYEDVELAN